MSSSSSSASAAAAAASPAPVFLVAQVLFPPEPLSELLREFKVELIPLLPGLPRQYVHISTLFRNRASYDFRRSADVEGLQRLMNQYNAKVNASRQTTVALRNKGDLATTLRLADQARRRETVAKRKAEESGLAMAAYPGGAAAAAASSSAAAAAGSPYQASPYMGLNRESGAAAAASVSSRPRAPTGRDAWNKLYLEPAQLKQYAEYTAWSQQPCPERELAARGLASPSVARIRQSWDSEGVGSYHLSCEDLKATYDRLKASPPGSGDDDHHPETGVMETQAFLDSITAAMRRTYPGQRIEPLKMHVQAPETEARIRKAMMSMIAPSNYKPNAALVRKATARLAYLDRELAARAQGQTLPPWKGFGAPLAAPGAAQHIIPQHPQPDWIGAGLAGHMGDIGPVIAGMTLNQHRAAQRARSMSRSRPHPQSGSGSGSHMEG
jgi:hypothetical protein